MCSGWKITRLYSVLLLIALAFSNSAQASREDFPQSDAPEVATQLNRLQKTPSGRRLMKESISRMERHRPTLEAAIKSHDMPSELLAIPIVESGFRNLRQTKKQKYGAGVWMFVRATARHYGLKINSEADQRLDIALATDAAMRYLKDLYKIFQNWELALLAYNAGEGTVRTGIKATGSRDAWDLIAAGYCNDPNYLAKVLATARLMPLR